MMTLKVIIVLIGNEHYILKELSRLRMLYKWCHHILVLEEKIVSRPPSANPFSSGQYQKFMSRPASVHGSTKQSTNGTSRSRGMPGHVTNVTKTSVSVPIKLSKEYQSKIFDVLGAKNKQSLSGNEIELFSAENPGDDNKVLLDALRAFTDRRITKCSFVFPEKVCNAFK